MLPTTNQCKDVIGEITFSKDFGFVRKGNHDGTFDTIEESLFLNSWIGHVPWLFWMKLRLAPIIGEGSSSSSRNSTIRKTAVAAVQDRQESGKKQTDILTRLLEVHKKDPEGLPYYGVLSMATSNVFAGSDTTAISLRSMFYYILKNPQCENRLLEEIYAFRKEGKLSNPVRFHESRQMPYLQACMKEALRLHPAIGFTLPRVTPVGGVTIAGKFIPEGIVVGVSPWVVHRNEEVYGEDVESFKPERWLSGSEDMERYTFTFGAGARGCLGRSKSYP